MAIPAPNPTLSRDAQPGPLTFSMLYLLESAARATMLTVLPLTVFAFVQSKETVSLVYTLVSLAAFSISFAIPALVRRISRRWTYTLGAGLIGLCGALVALGAGWAAPFALLARTTGTAMLNITLSLYIMDNIDRRELLRSEPLRLGIATLAWTLMPYAGVLLMERFGPGGPGLLCLGLVAALLAAFWALGLREIGPARPGVARPANPIRTIGRFLAQPRLRLAWAIAFARSCFWVTFFVYVPILLVEGGQGPTAAAAAVAAANLMLFNNLYMRRVAAWLTLRRTLAGAFLGAATLTAAAALGAAAGNAAAAAAAMVAGSFFTATIDGLGPIPFLRAVHSYERAQMTTVYRTYLDASDLLPPAVYFVVFMAFGFAGAFAVLAALLGYVGWLTWRHLPRGM